ncbi:hypothetical protein K2173_016487 [Erythroxylum novogranatense]|uniref:Uncharacterized protein n=1 Tax=Erythroxylum novogranatense TaxID=1862640 RepID=A0AAV8SH91_9ROSI|nr:hypothetical protein K2173_016487 [Erythroxylum novogranatense]
MGGETRRGREMCLERSSEKLRLGGLSFCEGKVEILCLAERERKGMSGMERLQWMFAGAGGALGHPPPDSPTLDSSEQVYISSLALLKMLKHEF